MASEAPKVLITLKYLGRMQYFKMNINKIYPTGRIPTFALFVVLATVVVVLVPNKLFMVTISL